MKVIHESHLWVIHESYPWWSSMTVHDSPWQQDRNCKPSLACFSQGFEYSSILAQKALTACRALTLNILIKFIILISISISMYFIFVLVAGWRTGYSYSFLRIVNYLNLWYKNVCANKILMPFIFTIVHRKDKETLYASVGQNVEITMFPNFYDITLSIEVSRYCIDSIFFLTELF